MMRLVESTVYKKISKLDRMIRIGIDRTLPKNLTIRYVSALIAVAALAISGQLIIQTSLIRQTEDQRKLRMLERQIQESENLRKAILSLQLSSKDSQIKLQIELIESLATELQKNGEILNKQGIENDIELTSPDELTTALMKIGTGLTAITDRVHTLNINTTTLDLLTKEAIYRGALTEISKYYDQALERHIVRFKTIELLLLFTTLLVLMIEALYVFRPGVENLYDALRIRSDFLGRMGHEMRNPMNSILGMTHLLFETQPTDQQQKYLSILQKSSTGLLEVLNNLLDFSSLESGTIKVDQSPFDLYKLLERSIDLAVYGAHANGIELVLDLGTDVPLQLTGDPVRLQQILTNLLGNAVKFTQKGEVVLKVQLHRKTGNQASIQFSVIDTGMGIDKDKVAKIFDAFVQEDSTVRRRFGGTGLGLSISKDLVNLLGGALGVESQKNIGSRFYFTLPISIAQDVTVSTLVETWKMGSYTVWMAEPNDAMADSLTRLVEQSGGRVSRLRTGVEQDLTELLTRISPSSERREVVILDYEFCKEALPAFFTRVRRGTLKTDAFVFLIKTTASSTDIEKLAEYGIKNFIFKPSKPLQLLEAVSQGLASLPAERSRDVLLQSVELVHDSRPLRVLAVDDSKDNQFLVKAYLKSLPYRLTFADHGRIAVEKFKAAHFDIVLMDLQMPEMDGYTATKIIREWEVTEQLTPTPIVAVSAHDQESVSDRFRESQFSSYLVKPISPNQLRKAILSFTQHILVSVPEPYSGRQAGQETAIVELEKQLAALAPQYLNNRRKEVGELKHLLFAGSYDKIQSLGHRLKGNAKSYGFEELGLIGRKLEDAAENQDSSEIRNLIQETEVYLDRLNQTSQSNHLN